MVILSISEQDLSHQVVLEQELFKDISKIILFQDNSTRITGISLSLTHASPTAKLSI